MGWFARKIDTQIGSVAAIVGGMAFSQVLQFIAYYQQRLGGHMDEAKRQAEALAVYARAGTDGEAARTLAETAMERYDYLHGMHAAIDSAPSLTRPFVFASHFDAGIARAALGGFEPAFPLDPASLLYAGAGLVIGWMGYELIKLPITLPWHVLARRRRARSRP